MTYSAVAPETLAEGPCKGDRVRLRDCAVTVRGTVVDEYSAEYVSVKWDDLPAPATYRRASLIREAPGASAEVVRSLTR